MRACAAGSPPAASPGVLAALALGRFRPTPGRLVMPDVCCDLTWARGRLFVTGPVSSGRASQNVGEEVWLLRLDPLVARAWLRTPLRELRDASLQLADVAPGLARELEGLPEQGGLERLVRPAGDVAAAGVDPRLVVAARALRRGERVARVAERVSLSERQLERVFAAELGLAPKTFARILRFRKALRAANGGAALVDAALGAGYADQAHFSRDVRVFTGVSARVLLPRVGNVQDIVAGAM